MSEPPRLEPYVGDDIVSVSAPAFMVSPRDGQLRGDGVRGVYSADRRVLSLLRLTIDGREPEPIHSELADGEDAAAAFVAAYRRPGDPAVGVATTVERLRRLTDGAGAGPTVATERIIVRSRVTRPEPVELRLRVSADLADISEVRSGRAGDGAGVVVEACDDGVRWRAADGLGVAVRTATEAGDGTRFGIERDGDGTSATLVWTLPLTAGETHEVGVRLDVEHPVGAPPVARPSCKCPWVRPHVRTTDARLTGLLRRGLTDMESLLLATPESTEDAFLAAGSPWYLTLFGRDSLWAARMMLPLGTRLARGTLRTLADCQGVATDPATEEAPGKIIHELRRTPTVHAAGLELPARYYGSVDATPLFVVLLTEAWRWGMPVAEVRELLPAAERALGWLRATVPADGFLSYCPASGSGLANQGWKDSADSVQDEDGRVAAPPIALAEAQAYAYQAAMGGADLLEQVAGRAGEAAEWRGWAAGLRARFRARFWVEDKVGRYPAIAVDGGGRAVTGAASNMGHLLGTGLLDAGESAAVARRLAEPDLTVAWGLRTLGHASAGFNPLGYHTGSIWAHDTAIAIRGLAADGHHQAAARLIEGLLAAGDRFGFRLPELWGGEERGQWQSPIPYPAACRPQAWAAASSIALLHAMVGLYPDVPAGTYRIDPAATEGSGLSRVTGFQVSDHQVDLRVAPDGTVTPAADLPDLHRTT
ncbi:MAG TPA: glycogen debranching N-terminal domain-containing protein [Streptosporangiaceae bacterium]